MKILTLSLGLLFLFCDVAISQSTDGIDKIESIRTADLTISNITNTARINPGVPLSESTAVEDILYQRFAQKYRGRVSTIEPINTLRVTSGNVAVGAKLSSNPSQFAEETYVLTNDSNDVQTKKFTITLKHDEGETITFEKILTTKNESKYDLKFGISWGAVTIGGEDQQTQLREVKVTNKNEFRRSQTREYKEEFEQKVHPKKRLEIKIRREILSETYALGGTVTLEGTILVKYSWKDVYACGFMGTDRCSRTKHDNRTINLSDVLNEAERTFTLDGRAVIASSANTRTEATYTASDIK